MNSRVIGRIVALAAVVIGAAAIGIVLATHDGTDYTVHARFINASQLVKGDLVQVSGAPIGKVTSITLTPDGEADVALHITKEETIVFPLLSAPGAERRSHPARGRTGPRGVRAAAGRAVAKEGSR